MKTVDVSEMTRFDPVRPVSKVVLDTPQARVLLFCLEAGQVVPAHGVDAEVIFYTISGSGTVTVGDEEIKLEPGLLVECAPNVQHGLRAANSLVVLATIAPRPW